MCAVWASGRVVGAYTPYSLCTDADQNLAMTRIIISHYIGRNTFCTYMRNNVGEIMTTYLYCVFLVYGITIYFYKFTYVTLII